MGVLKNGKEMYQGLCKLRNMEEAYEEWQRYRKEVTQYILQNTESGKTVAILGAGRCNDIDLADFANHFSEISLIDIDEEAMKDALKKYNLVFKENINIIVQDFVGISEDDYIEYANIMYKDIKKMLSFFSPMVTAPKMIKKLDSVYSNLKSFELNLGNKKYDYVVVLGVHSQLNTTFEWMWRMMLERHNKFDNTVARRISKETDYIVNKFDNAIHKTAKKKIFVGCERGIVGMTRGIEGADNELKSIEKFENEGVVKLIDWFDTIWPFDTRQKLQYNMAICQLEML